MIRVSIIDSGGGNLNSVFFALQRMGVQTELVQDLESFHKAQILILPGVGNAKHCRERLENLNLWEPLQTTSKPILGICIGMQLMFSHLDEGPIDGLGLLTGSVQSFTPSLEYPVPHMGWNHIQVVNSNDPLFKGIENEAFYFTHSFFAPVETEGILASTTYGKPIASAVRNGNWWGVQFHPEKSSRAGSILLKNFIDFNSLTSDSNHIKTKN